MRGIDFLQLLFAKSFLADLFLNSLLTIFEKEYAINKYIGSGVFIATKKVYSLQHSQSCDILSASYAIAFAVFPPLFLALAT